MPRVIRQRHLTVNHSTGHQQVSARLLHHNETTTPMGEIMSTNISTAAVTPPPLSAWGERHGAAAQLAADIRERTGDLEDLPRENPRWLGSDDIYGESTVTIADVIHEAKHIGFAVEIPYEGLEWLGLDYDGSSAGAFEMVGTREQIEAAAAHLANAAAALQEFLKV